MSSQPSIRVHAPKLQRRRRAGRLPMWERLLRVGLMIASAVLLLLAVVARIPNARADNAVYLIDVTVRPGYNFPDAEAALSYGYHLCEKVSGGRSYAEVIGDIKADFNTGDEFQASYLIDKAVNELCPAQIWQLRQTAAHYRPPGP